MNASYIKPDKMYVHKYSELTIYNNITISKWISSITW